MSMRVPSPLQAHSKPLSPTFNPRPPHSRLLTPPIDRQGQSTDIQDFGLISGAHAIHWRTLQLYTRSASEDHRIPLSPTTRTLAPGVTSACCGGAVKKKDGQRDLVVNRRARHEFELLDRFEAGLALVGSEVKSIRAGQANLGEAFVRLGKDGAWLVQCHVSPYAEANRQNHDPVRQRRLLLKQPELLKLRRGLLQKGMTIVPLRLYLKGHLVKLELALGRGRKLHDKRDAMKKRQADKDLRRR